MASKRKEMHAQAVNLRERFFSHLCALMSSPVFYFFTLVNAVEEVNVSHLSKLLLSHFFLQVCGFTLIKPR